MLCPVCLLRSSKEVIFIATSEVDCAWDLVAPSGCITVPLYVTQEGTLIQQLAWAYLPSTVDTHWNSCCLRPVGADTKCWFVNTFCTPLPRGATAPCGPGPPRYWNYTITLTHTTLGSSPLDEWSERHRDLYLTTHNNHKRHTSMSAAGFEPTVPGSERPLVLSLTSYSYNCRMVKYRNIQSYREPPTFCGRLQGGIRRRQSQHL
jgi:hypothetical protein